MFETDIDRDNDIVCLFTVLPTLTLTLFVCLTVILTLKTDIVCLFETYIDTGQ